AYEIVRCLEFRRVLFRSEQRCCFTWLVRNDDDGDLRFAAIISGVAHDRSEAKVSVVGVPDKPGEAAALFRVLAEAEVNLDMIVEIGRAARRERESGWSSA